MLIEVGEDIDRGDIESGTSRGISHRARRPADNDYARHLVAS
jgi:hypothetical protein